MRLVCCCLLLMAALPLRAQDRCGQTAAPDTYHDQLRLAGQIALRTDSLVHLPVRFHLVGQNNGNGRAQPARVLPLLCELNAQFAPAGIRFFLDDIRLVNNSGIFSQHHLNLNQQAMRALRADSVINVFVVQNAGPVGEQNVVGYFDADDDWLVLRRDGLRAGNLTLAHEIGHFLGLVHPHFGWDSQGWNQPTPAPVLASDGLTETERADGSNCQTAGDRLCDTPADYNNGLAWQQSCQFGDTIYDPAGQPIDPDERLIMSYFNDSCRAIFSPQQQVLMLASLLLPARSELAGQFADTQALADPPQLLLPADTADIRSDSIRLKWSSVGGATRYLVETDRSVAFDLDPQTLFTSDTSLWASGNWISGQRYYWRVWAYKAGYTCSDPAPAGSFVAVPLSVGVRDEITPVNWRQWQANGRLFLAVSTSAHDVVVTEIGDLQGRVLVRETRALPAGEQVLSWELSDFPAGWYFFRMTGSQHVHFSLMIP